MTIEASHEILFFPDWGHRWPLWGPVGLRPEHLNLSEDLALRLTAWVKIWQVELDPVVEIRWPSVELGRAWVAEGYALCAEVQAAVERQGIKVIPRFSEFSPDGSF